ncbi:hypothetical protein ZWY2020_017085 [Hordeum vulgare]|nr:hypothetical protein ZWY2020_017085 [Hordeum vulgare]
MPCCLKNEEGHDSNAVRHHGFPLEALLNEVNALVFKACELVTPWRYGRGVSFMLMLFKLGKSTTDSQAQVNQTRSRPADSFRFVDRRRMFLL